jgi:hypothetical protein
VATGPGRGRIRYALPWFPERDYTLLVRVAPKAFPQGRIGQVFSAWARGMDDPLRVTIDGGKIHARMEAGSFLSTPGVEIKEGVWIHVAAVKRGPRLELWIDGEAKASVAVPEQVESAAANVALGANPNFSGDESLEAPFADFAFYARALSDEEIRRAANQPADG